jgi:hypothetical protein
LLMCSSHLLLGFPTGRSFTSSTPHHQLAILIARAKEDGQVLGLVPHLFEGGISIL